MSATDYVSHDEASLRDAASTAVEHARRMGAEGARATADADGGCRFVLRGGEVETRLRDGAQSLGITVFSGGRTGSASTTALDLASVRLAAERAVAIAGRVQPDPDAALADPSWLATGDDSPPLYVPSGLPPEEWLRLACAGDEEARAVAGDDARGLLVDETGIATRESRRALATSDGFCRSAAAAHHARWVAMIKRSDDGAVRDYAGDTDRRIDMLQPASVLAARALARTAGQSDPRPMASGAMPVLFASRVADALVWDVVEALGGAAQHRRTSFLQDALDQPVAAAFIDLIEDPEEPYGLSSGAFDAEGVAGRRRPVIEAGVARGYFLGSLSARRLGMRSTGNAGGAWNLRLTSRVGGSDEAELRARMGDGLLISHLLGGATDPVTGNWTRAVAGFRIVGGEIAYPVRDLTLAGRMPDMLRAIVAVGEDVERQGAVRTGSVLISEMMVGTAA